MRKTVFIVGTAVTLLAALAAGSALAGPMGASQQGARVLDADADLHWNGKIRLEAETAGANRVWITYAGTRYRAKLVEIDRQEGTREWARTVRATSAHRAGGRTVTIRVRACAAGGRCAVRSEREYLDREDD